MTASADGTLVALAVDDGVALVRIGASAAKTERVRGRLVPGTTPLVATSHSAAGVVEMHDVARDAVYRVPLAIGGIEWNERTTWRAADGALVRAVTSKTVQAASLHGYTPNTSAAAWRVDLDAGVADLAISGDQVIVQLTDGRGRSELAAFDVHDGRALWRLATRATFFDEGALAIADGVVATVLANPAACETCEQVELHDVATGRLIRTVALTGPSVVRSASDRGIRTEFGLAGDELWARLHVLGDDGDGFHEFGRRGHTCTYDVFDLKTGAVRPAAGEWAALLEACDWPVLLAPIDDGLIAVRHDEHSIAIGRLSRAP
ncbi:MAG: PQQ-binding-like beta-propeller repeat protein [Myxococcales bacterium]|nr:PQQ-binding-like beta-propeller repeat protein [Myxococcales bacterium]